MCNVASYNYDFLNVHVLPSDFSCAKQKNVLLQASRRKPDTVICRSAHIPIDPVMKHMSKNVEPSH